MAVLLRGRRRHRQERARAICPLRLSRLRPKSERARAHYGSFLQNKTLGSGVINKTRRNEIAYETGT